MKSISNIFDPRTNFSRNIIGDIGVCSNAL